MVSTGIYMDRRLRPFHSLLLPLSPALTVIAHTRPNYKYPAIRALRFLPSWAMDLAPFHRDYQPEENYQRSGQ